ncbi:ATP-binding protein [Inconstantimicrobium mannanitabidum]|uniref:PAS domain-containing sensor histidine kinase n=1 Tax=Inconstantimicrobium mannanitabidum TaxID=1604901 RepID=A0ACB5RBQ7_9CLOT|nr:ATP-binding protein [Clostridium sp. TW13]GKX66597.1 PAS domain-containing sensor histidine kinase [Clostridium sp. TW13]
MKNKVIAYVMGTILFSLVILTACFITITNHQHINTIRLELQEYNRLLSEMINKTDNPVSVVSNITKDKSDIRITLINKSGEVEYDSDTLLKNLDNHANREEILMAEKNNEGYSIRYSKTLKKDMLYYATKLNDNGIIRTSIPLEHIKMFEDKNGQYYIVTLIAVIFLSIFMSLKLSVVIVNPLKKLESVAYEMSEGDLTKRVSVKSKDELGRLGCAFNHMADTLQLTLNELVDKQNRLEAILKSMDSGVIAVDKEHNVIMINPYAEKIFGIKGDIIGEKLMNHVRDFELDNVFDSEKDSVEITIINPIERDLRIKTAEIINGKEHIGKVAVVQDITDIKKLENMRSQFVANVSHELKTPLTSIRGFSETLLEVDDEETRKKFLGIINDEAERLARLINDILTLSNLEQCNKLHEETNDMDFSPELIIDNVVSLVKLEASKKNIEIETSLKNNNHIWGAPDKFKQMIIILLDNAIKYSESGDKIFINTYEEEGKNVIEVQDTGIGIPEKDLPRIFERFYRVDKARSRAKGGTGLGLAILKHIVISFGGTVEVQSRLGEGTKFTIKL